MPDTNKKVSVVIVGGGLSGLHTAYELQKLNIEFKLLEARDRLGGRILSKQSDTAERRPTSAAFDLGPSWFWPHQNRINKLIHELGLSGQVFEQTASGDSLYEDQNGAVHSAMANASMRGSYRIKGGIQSLVNAVHGHISTHSYQIQSVVEAIHFKNNRLSVAYRCENQLLEIQSDYVVLAMPPRIAVNSIAFNPALDPARVHHLKGVATWMAGQAKAAILYDNDFWHEQGFSGDVISHRGPLQEIHDANSPRQEPFGLIGFISQGAESRRPKASELRIEIIRQLIKLFGPQAASPIEIFIKDWAIDPYTATQDDQAPILFHPSGNFTTAAEANWNNRLIWSGTETAGDHEHNFGYLEGALQASERTLDLLT